MPASCGKLNKPSGGSKRVGEMIDPRKAFAKASFGAPDVSVKNVSPAALILGALLLSAAVEDRALAQSQQAKAPAAENQTQANTPPKAAHEAAPHFSKLEARRIRHVCYGRANEQGLRGAERSAFLSHCYFGRVSHRGVRHACQKEGSSKGLDRTALRDFVRECVKERTAPKNMKDENAPTKGL